MWTWLEKYAVLRTAARGIVRGESPAGGLLGYPFRLVKDLSFSDWQEIYANRALLKEAARFRRTAKPPFDLAQLLETGLPEFSRMWH